jgi:hypothetical protein
VDDVTGRTGKRQFQKSEAELAKELLKVLDGVSIRHATNALEHAIQLLGTTQIVNSESPLLLIEALLVEPRSEP